MMKAHLQLWEIRLSVAHLWYVNIFFFMDNEYKIVFSSWKIWEGSLWLTFMTIKWYAYFILSEYLTYPICVLSVDFTLIPSNPSLPSGLGNGSFPHLEGAVLASATLPVLVYPDLLEQPSYILTCIWVCLQEYHISPSKPAIVVTGLVSSCISGMYCCIPWWRALANHALQMWNPSCCLCTTPWASPSTRHQALITDHPPPTAR